MDRTELCRRMEACAKRKAPRRKLHTHYVDCSKLQMSIHWRRRRRQAPAGTMLRARRWFKRMLKHLQKPVLVPAFLKTAADRISSR